VRQVGYLQELKGDARSTKHKIKIYVLDVPVSCVLWHLVVNLYLVYQQTSFLKV